VRLADKKALQCLPARGGWREMLFGLWSKQRRSDCGAGKKSACAEEGFMIASV
jgi:hypothetical protein